MLGGRAASMAALFLAVSPIMVAESKLATTDATLTLWLVGCQFCLAELAQRPSRALAATFWACMGLAFLTKGPVGPAVLGVSNLVAWWWGWPAREVWRRLHPRWGLLACLLIAAPWYVHIALMSRGEFVRFAVGTQLVQRVASGMEEHGGFPGYYLVLSLVAFYPWSAMAPSALVEAWRRRRSNPSLAFLLGWVIGPWILLECVRTKLLHYYLPAYPALALVVAWLVEATVREGLSMRRRSLGRLGMGLLGGIGISASLGLAAATVMSPYGLRPPLALLTILSCGVTLVALCWLHRGSTQTAVVVLAAGWGLFMAVLGGWLIPAAEPFRTSRVVGERLAELRDRTGIEPVLLNYQEPGLIYTMKQPIAAVRDRQRLYDLLDRHETLLSVVTPEEQELFSQKYGLEMTVVDTYDGISLTKGKSHRLNFTLVRRKVERDGRAESTARSGGGEQTLVK
jgi:4-amino-4-deoxy-L-arabinose transferase-like glycosyltransferase